MSCLAREKLWWTMRANIKIDTSDECLTPVAIKPKSIFNFYSHSYRARRRRIYKRDRSKEKLMNSWCHLIDMRKCNCHSQKASAHDARESTAWQKNARHNRMGREIDVMGEIMDSRFEIGRVWAELGIDWNWQKTFFFHFFSRNQNLIFSGSTEPHPPTHARENENLSELKFTRITQMKIIFRASISKNKYIKFLFKQSNQFRVIKLLAVATPRFRCCWAEPFTTQIQ